MADYKPILEEHREIHRASMLIWFCIVMTFILLGLTCTLCSFRFLTFFSNQKLMNMGPLFIMSGASVIPARDFLGHFIKMREASSLLKLHDSYDSETMKSLVEIFLKKDK